MKNNKNSLFAFIVWGKEYKAREALFYIKTSSAICGKKNQCKICSLWQEAEVICKTSLLLSSCVHRNGCFLDVNLSWSNGLENLTDENSAILALKETGQVIALLHSQSMIQNT